MKISITRLILYTLLLDVMSLFIVSCQQTPPPKIKLKFNDKGKFKIAQFTDMHCINGSPTVAKTISNIQFILKTERPDLVVLTGDVAYNKPSRQLWQDIPLIFEKAHVPFMVALGNHDSEGNTEMDRDEIFDILSRSPFFVGEKGPGEIRGTGNCVVPVYGKDNTPGALLYCFDSHASSLQKVYGTYDWIHFDQINWYRNKSLAYTKQNDGKPLPALAFFHIPLPEYKEITNQPNTIGTFGEGIGSPEINSGLFGAFVDMQDVKGVFAGHDHSNDFIGLNHDIALGYGRVSGFNAYGSLTRGARIIEIYENQFKFDSWITTPERKELFFHYPSGISSVDEETMSYLPAKQVNPTKHGVAYTYKEGTFKSFDDTLKAVKTLKGTMANLSIDKAPAEDYFAYNFRSFIHIPERGVYRFYTRSDDHSKVIIDGELIVLNRNKSGYYAYGKVALEAGFHELEVQYFEYLWAQHLEVGFCDKNTFEHPIPDSMLFVPE